ncbi:MFS transporter [Kribbella qitaiheensis]|uniref:MFS transporter n=1 Tax=Kribbella qitaiheensis TaxID=1544730 RepID=A0A7G6X484_9ACTN|nr:MFS transporter [Kribbella qitaiheensis]QNE21049.1 MFS transporter [Kribbella qitaiheensis]
MTSRELRHRYALISFLTWLPTGLFIPVLVVLLLERGIGLTTIAALGVAYSVTVMLLELPTGGLADVVGRRPVMVASAASSLAALILLGFADSLVLLALSAVLRGVGRALGSGPVEAWYVDQANELPDADLTHGLSVGAMASSVALAVGTVAGGVIPFGLGATLALPVLLAAGADGVRLVVTLVAMPEPKYEAKTLRSVVRGVPSAIASGVRVAGRSVVLIRILMVSAGMGTTLAVMELLTPAWLTELAGAADRGVLAYGLVAAVGFAADALGSGLSMPLLRRLGSVRAVCLAGYTVSSLALAGMAAATAVDGIAGVLAAAIAYSLMFVGLGVTAGPLAQLLHSQVDAAERATVVSVESLILMLAGAVGVVGLGQLAVSTHPAVAFGVTAVVLAVLAAPVIAVTQGSEVRGVAGDLAAGGVLPAAAGAAGREAVDSSPDRR